MLLAAACAPASPGYDPSEEMAGGALGTTRTTSQDAYTQPMPGLTFDQTQDFEVGNSFDANDWVVAAGVHLLCEGMLLTPVDHDNRRVDAAAAPAVATAN
jgi:CxxC motif-containing protein (DUF1111 family)